MDDQYIYLLLGVDPCWEDLVMFLDRDKAIEASEKYPEARVEIFRKEKSGEFLPTYNYFSDGEEYRED